MGNILVICLLNVFWSFLIVKIGIQKIMGKKNWDMAYADRTKKGYNEDKKISKKEK